MRDPSPLARNGLLASLPEEELRRLEAHGEPLALEAGQSLFEPGDRIETVIFPLSGMISILTVMQDGSEVEGACIGREGAAGLMPAMASGRAFRRARVQIPGEALRIGREPLFAGPEDGRAVRRLSERYAEALLMQVLQLVACNARHPVDARLGRWLLAAADRVQGATIPATQELLSSMLGVSRTTITEAARGMQTSGLIEVRRGAIRILDRPGLERAACECQGLIRRRFAELFPPHAPAAAG